MCSLPPQGILGVETPVRPEAPGEAAVTFGLDICSLTWVRLGHANPMETDGFF